MAWERMSKEVVRFRHVLAWGVLLLTLQCFTTDLLRAQESEPQESTEEDTFNPYLANKDVKIGDFYFKKGNYDAAIARYRAAARHKPNFAIPFLKMGKAYEKKHETKEAIKAYQKYLEILPKGNDAAYARERIEKLEHEKN